MFYEDEVQLFLELFGDFENVLFVSKRNDDRLHTVE